MTSFAELFCTAARQMGGDKTEYDCLMEKALGVDSRNINKYFEDKMCELWKYYRLFKEEVIISTDSCPGLCSFQRPFDFSSILCKEWDERAAGDNDYDHAGIYNSDEERSCFLEVLASWSDSVSTCFEVEPYDNSKANVVFKVFNINKNGIDMLVPMSYLFNSETRTVRWYNEYTKEYSDTEITPIVACDTSLDSIYAGVLVNVDDMLIPIFELDDMSGFIYQCLNVYKCELHGIEYLKEEHIEIVSDCDKVVANVDEFNKVFGVTTISNKDTTDTEKALCYVTPDNKIVKVTIPEFSDGSVMQCTRHFDNYYLFNGYYKL